MKHRSVQEMFSGVAAEFGPQVAIEHGGRTLTYSQLEAESNRLANFLLDGGLSRGGMVGLFTDNPAAVITGILGVLKAGGVFVPLDPTFPERRLQMLSGQVRPEWFVSAGRHLLKLGRLRGEASARARVICLDAQDEASGFAADGLEVLESYGSYDNTSHPAVAPDPEAPCSVYFTSGSTGKPKAILGRLKGIDHFMRWEIEAVGAGPGTRVTQLASPSFDGFLKDAFVPLCSGGTVCAPESRDIILDAWSLADWLDVEQVEVLHCVPSVFRALTNEKLNSRYFESMKSAVLTGEPLYPSDVKRWMDIFGTRVRLWNIYGTTETSMSKFAHEITPADLERPSIPVGRPIKGAAVMVINSRGQLCREEAVGEVHIRTPYRSHGYYGEPGLTEEVFIPNPFGDDPADLLHKTGDFGRLLKSGELELLGRRDQQVKVRGVRVELGEVENLLRAHEAVADVAVVDRDDAEGTKFLVAYVTMSNGTRAEELRPYLAERLPEPMMPSAFVELPHLPRTLNGKIDRKALPALELLQAEREMSEMVPRSPIEEIVSGIWCEVLRLPAVGLRSNFFNLGGHSLLATQVILRVRNMLQVELPVRSMFESPTVEQLSLLIQEQIGEGRQNALAPIAPVPRDGELPLSFAQRRMWLIEQMGRGTTTFHIPLRVRLEGALNVAALEQTFGEIVRRHEILRTVFTDVTGEPVQTIRPPARVRIPLTDLSGLRESEREAAAERLAAAEHARLFELDAGPLARPRLIRLSAGEHVLVCTLHHIVSDGWSKGVLIKEMSALYEAFGRGEPSPLPEPPIQYADFGAWERGWLSGDTLERELGYWKEKLAGAPPVLELNTDRPRPPVQMYRGSLVPFGLSRRLTDDLKALGRRTGVTLFMTLLAGFQTLLHRYTSQDDVVVGTTVANRDRFEVEGLIGCFVNMLALRADCSGDPRFEELLEAVRETTLKAYAHQGLPFEKLVEELQPARRPGHATLVQAVFNFHNQPTLTELTLPGLTLSFPAFDFATSQFDLILDMSEGPEGLAGALYYNRDLFDPETISLMVEHLSNLLEGAAANPAQHLSSLPLMGEAERRQLLEVWGRTAAEYTAGACIHELFERQAARTPERVALVCGGERLTYSELNVRADGLARRLRALGAAPDTRVGIHLPRSNDMVVAVLGVLKAGGAYVPLDPAYPADRLAFMLKDSGAFLLVTERRLLGALPAAAAVPVCMDDEESEAVGHDEVAAAPTGPENLAYVIYTSGSTGRPKGVMVEHSAAVNLALAQHQAIYSHHRTASGLRVSLNAPLVFDASVERMLLLLSGHTVYVIPEEVRQDSDAMLAYVERHALDVLDCTPSQLRLLIEAGLTERPGVSARLVLAGGEPIDEQLWQALAGQGRVDFFNVYGPTECTVNSSVCRVSTSPRRPTIGRPLAGVEVYILDERQRLVPVGVVGELHVGGAGLARGYLGRPGLTAEKFVPHPFATRPGQRLYRTADRARFLPDGQIEFLGRADGQLKIRGFRIEPGEVEAVLAEHEALKEALVVAAGEGAGGKRLAAYVVAAAGVRVPPAAELRAFLKGRLPDYMIPASFAALDALPLTPSGKVNRKALPAAEWVSGAERYRGPRTPEEEVLCGLFAEALGVERVGIEDDFFELGGHSLLATRLASRVRAVLGVELAIRTLFESPTVARLSPQLRAGDSEGAPLTRQERRGSLPLSYSQRRLWFLDQLMPGGNAYNIPVGLLMTGRLNVPALRYSLEETIRRHESLRTTFRDEGGEPVQVVAEARPLELPVVDLERFAAAERESLVERLASEDGARPFDLAEGPLFRSTLLRLSEREHVLLVVMHHIISDGWSTEILIRDVGELYKAFCEGRPASLPDLSLQYADFALWQRGRMEGGRMRAGLDYWRRQLGRPERLELPADPPPTRADLRGRGLPGGPESRAVGGAAAAEPRAARDALRCAAGRRRCCSVGTPGGTTSWWGRRWRTGRRRGSKTSSGSSSTRW
nr:AMP-dependent synthetase and ligase [uncultured bacterium]